jgi:hypothetical protein
MIEEDLDQGTATTGVRKCRGDSGPGRLTAECCRAQICPPPAWGIEGRAIERQHADCLGGPGAGQVALAARAALHWFIRTGPGYVLADHR